MKIRIDQPFEANYDPGSKELLLRHVEAVSGRQIDILFSAQMTRALFDSLLAVAEVLQTTPGAETIKLPNLQ